MARVFDDFERAVWQQGMHQVVAFNWAKCVVSSAEDEGFSKVGFQGVLLVGAVA